MPTPKTWWPPKVGDKLSHATQHSAGDLRIKQVEALVHVVSIFEHNGKTMAVVAEWFPARKRWSYEVIGEIETEFRQYWPDGMPRPASREKP